MNTRPLRLESLSDDLLLARVVELVGRNRRIETELVWHLAEVDRRRLYLREACPSMHVYATSRLHLSDAEAYLRITVARLSRRFPAVLTMLSEGRLHLSAAAKLAPHLRDDNAEALLARAAHRSKREIELLVAELAPRPDVPSLMRRLPAARVATAPVVPTGAEFGPGGVGSRAVADGSVQLGHPSSAGATLASPAGTPAPPRATQAALPAAHDAAVNASIASVAGPVAAAAPPALSASSLGASAVQTAPPVPEARLGRGQSAVLAPIAPSRYRVQFTAGAELHDKIARARALLRHQIPDGDLAAVVDRAMTLLVRELERGRFAATQAPRKEADQVDATPSSRRIPDPIRRAVWIRDGEQCTFRDRSGRRCPARERLEFHHLTPFARGGDHSASNVTLRCAAHNAHQADLDFGAAFMAAHRREARGAAQTP